MDASESTLLAIEGPMVKPKPIVSHSHQLSIEGSAKTESAGPIFRKTKLLCPLCSTYLFQRGDLNWPNVPYWYLECGLCDTRFESVDIHRAKEWAWVIIGTILFTLAIVFVFALAVGEHSTCADVRFDGEYFCADEGQANTWFDSREATVIRSISLIAAIAIPVTFVIAATRMLWLLVFPIAFVAGLVIGIVLGEWAVHRWFPEMYWEYPERGSFIVAWVICGAPLIFIVAFLALILTASRPSRWRLTRLTQDLKEWPGVGGT